LVKGSIPDTLNDVQIEDICFLHIDMNCALPEVEALKFFWDKMVKGGMVILDDYGWLYHIEQKRAIDEFAKPKGINILTLPTGQGILIKK
jgi:O-methyltransferase